MKTIALIIVAVVGVFAFAPSSHSFNCKVGNSMYQVGVVCKLMTK